MKLGLLRAGLLIPSSLFYSTKMRWSYYVFSILVLFSIHVLSHPVPNSSFEDSQYSTLSRRAPVRSVRVKSALTGRVRTYHIRKSNARRVAMGFANPKRVFTSKHHAGKCCSKHHIYLYRLKGFGLYKIIFSNFRLSPAT